MTSPEFVRTFYPKAYLRCSSGYFAVLADSNGRWTFLSASTRSPKAAWQDARTIIEYQMLKKLEQ